ncbi:MAG TPA: LamG-like jellyroll fold domain-containing protein [Lacipirellula sp.]
MSVRQFVASALLVALVPALSAAAPLLQWTFDEASGNALDTGDAPANDGVLTGGAVRSSNTPSGFGSSVDLRNDSPYAHVLGGDAAKLDGLSALTLTTWLNVESYTSGNHRLVAKQASGNFGGFNFSMNAAPNDGAVGPDNFKIGLFLGNNVSSGAGDFGFAYATTDVDAANKWVMLAVTYDSSLASDNTRYYIGGVNTPVTQLGAPVTLPQLTVDGGLARFGVGFTDAAPAANTSVIGYQDDVRVYGSALDLAALEAVRLEGAVPEPGALSLAALGLAGLLLRRR